MAAPVTRRAPAPALESREVLLPGQLQVLGANALTQVLVAAVEVRAEVEQSNLGGGGIEGQQRVVVLGPTPIDRARLPPFVVTQVVANHHEQNWNRAQQQQQR